MADFVWESEQLQTAIRQFEPKVLGAIAATMEYHATTATAYARANAPWTDRTSNARNGLHAVTEIGVKQFSIIVAHGVPYGIWLEVKNSGRYQIILPTIRHEGPEVMKTLRQMFRRAR